MDNVRLARELRNQRLSDSRMHARAIVSHVPRVAAHSDAGVTSAARSWESSPLEAARVLDATGGAADRRNLPENAGLPADSRQSTSHFLKCGWSAHDVLST